jgi:hypothetical protein
MPLGFRKNIISIPVQICKDSLLFQVIGVLMRFIAVAAIIYSYYSTPARINQTVVLDNKFQYISPFFGEFNKQFIFIG